MIRIPAGDPFNGDFYTNPANGEALTLAQLDHVAATVLCLASGSDEFAPVSGMYGMVTLDGTDRVQVGIPLLGIVLMSEN